MTTSPTVRRNLSRSIQVWKRPVKVFHAFQLWLEIPTVRFWDERLFFVLYFTSWCRRDDFKQPHARLWPCSIKSLSQFKVWQKHSMHDYYVTSSRSKKQSFGTLSSLLFYDLLNDFRYMKTMRNAPGLNIILPASTFRLIKMSNNFTRKFWLLTLVFHSMIIVLI